MQFEVGQLVKFSGEDLRKNRFTGMGVYKGPSPMMFKHKKVFINTCHILIGQAKKSPRQTEPPILARNRKSYTESLQRFGHWG